MDEKAKTIGPDTHDDADCSEWVNEGVLNTACRLEELFLLTIHGIVKRLGKNPRARVNRKTVARILAAYKKHGRIFEPGLENPALPTEAIEALLWAQGKVPSLDQCDGPVN